MAGSIFLRASNAFRAHVEIGVDSAEQASRLGLARQSIRDVQAAIDDLRDQRFASERKRDRATQDIADHRSLASDWGEKAAYALGKGRQDLAEQAIERQLDAERAAETALDRERTESAEIDRLTERAAVLTSERDTMKQDLAVLERQRATTSSAPSGATAEQRMERARARFDQLVGEEQSTRPDTSAIDEIETLRRADAVAGRLEKLRPEAEPTTKRRAAKRR